MMGLVYKIVLDLEGQNIADLDGWEVDTRLYYIRHIFPSCLGLANKMKKFFSRKMFRVRMFESDGFLVEG